MALIKCSECGKEVSDQATACPQCGKPIANTALRADSVVTIQQTNKRWKAVKLASWLGIVAGVLLMQSAQGFGITLLTFGVIGLIVARFGSWWTNG